MGRLDVAIASRSDAGRRAGNEDRVVVGAAGWRRFAIVCDGAGGHARGAEAAQRASESIRAALLAATSFDASTLRRALQAAHAGLGAEQRGDSVAERMHTTAVVLWVDGLHDRALWAHVGDSRLYRLRHGRVEALTEDDSLVRQLVASGALTPRQAETHPMRSHLVAALGMHGPVVPHALPSPEPLEDGDAFLLCTDGWWGALGETAMAATWRDAPSVDAWLDAMQATIASRGAADQDNFSAVAVVLFDPQEDTRPPDDAA